MATERGHGWPRRFSSSTAPTTLLYTTHCSRTLTHGYASDTSSTDAAAAAAAAAALPLPPVRRARARERESGYIVRGGGESRRDGRRVGAGRDGFANGINCERRADGWRAGQTAGKKLETAVTATASTPRNTHRARLASTEGGHATEAPSRARTTARACTRRQQPAARAERSRVRPSPEMGDEMTRGTANAYAAFAVTPAQLTCCSRRLVVRYASPYHTRRR